MTTIFDPGPGTNMAVRDQGGELELEREKVFTRSLAKER